MIWPKRDLSTKYGRLSHKADQLCGLGDSLSKTKPAESRKVLRECGRYRDLAKQAKKEENAK